MSQGTESDRHCELANPGTRSLVPLIDGVLVLIVLAVPFLGLLVSIVYSLMKDAFPFIHGQSIGKRAMDIRAVKEGTGRPLTNDYRASMVRPLSLSIPFFGLINACMVWSAKRKRFGDRWAKTN